MWKKWFVNLLWLAALVNYVTSFLLSWTEGTWAVSEWTGTVTVDNLALEFAHNSFSEDQLDTQYINCIFGNCVNPYFPGLCIFWQRLLSKDVCWSVQAHPLVIWVGLHTLGAKDTKPEIRLEVGTQRISKTSCPHNKVFEQIKDQFIVQLRRDNNPWHLQLLLLFFRRFSPNCPEISLDNRLASVEQMILSHKIVTCSFMPMVGWRGQ